MEAEVSKQDVVLDLLSFHCCEEGVVAGVGASGALEEGDGVAVGVVA